ncbi:MAG: GNAT family N-acetyltransferase [Marinilabiliaceae bacterium]|nr:GNAT family N-acetyltransferase [Marinilabiliaceae bacterium]
MKSQPCITRPISPDQYESDLLHYPYSVFITRQWVMGMADDKDVPLFLEFVSDGQQVGLIAGLIIKGENVRGNQFYCYSGPAIRDNCKVLYSCCLSSLKRFAASHRYSRIFIRPWDQQGCHQCRARGFTNTETYEYVIFPENHPQQEITCSTRIQKNIKKGFKLNASIREGRTPQLLAMLLNMLNATRQRRTGKFGVAYDPFYLYNLQERSLQNLLDTGFATIYYVETDGIPHCMEYVVEHNGRIYNVLKGSDEFGYRNGLASYLDYMTINRFMKNGMVYYNYGGDLKGEDGQGLAMFKEGMGATRQERHGAHTFFLSYPHRLLNPLMKAGQCLPDHPLVKKIKVAVSHQFAGSSV